MLKADWQCHTGVGLSAFLIYTGYSIRSGFLLYIKLISVRFLQALL